MMLKYVIRTVFKVFYLRFWDKWSLNTHIPKYVDFQYYFSLHFLL